MEANLAMHSSALSLNEVEVGSLLAPNGASMLVSRLRTLALSVGSGSEAILASLSVHIGVLTLASQDKKAELCEELS